jgi:hypothetical protein
MRYLLFLLVLSGLAPFAHGSTNTWFVYRYQPIAGRDYYPPRTLIYQRTRVIYYLEASNTHIAAISPSGKLLWVVDPIQKMDDADPTHPVEPGAIDDLAFAKDGRGPPHGPRDGYLNVCYNTTLFARIRMSDGRCFYGGQD